MKTKFRNLNCCEFCKTRSYSMDLVWPLTSELWLWISVFFSFCASGFQCLALIFTAPIWDSEDRAINKERREWRVRSHRLKQDILNAVETAVVLAAPNRENDTFTAQKNRLQIIFFPPRFVCTGLWLNYRSSVHQHNCHCLWLKWDVKKLVPLSSGSSSLFRSLR